MLQRILSTNNARTTLLIRLMVGLVFLSEGLQKYLFPDQLGAGRFAKIGLPQPEFLGYFVGSLEILCGCMVLFGLLTRLAVLPLLIIMLVALGTTKVQILQHEGFWAMLHASRTDWAMLLGSLYLLIRGGGWASADQHWFCKLPRKAG